MKTSRIVPLALLLVVSATARIVAAANAFVSDA